ncbi:MAG: hypothetical protein CME62_12935 [Halobacteriovoraceae bacterium]|nr:hypothetical protein [Halobacteriovoraceae bacterium]|tara:strand:+ start:33715 stop:34047 length:333 start_codon:yes stop_codon:yes gene_type:complete
MKLILITLIAILSFSYKSVAVEGRRKVHIVKDHQYYFCHKKSEIELQKSPRITIPKCMIELSISFDNKNSHLIKPLTVKSVTAENLTISHEDLAKDINVKKIRPCYSHNK